MNKKKDNIKNKDKKINNKSKKKYNYKGKYPVGSKKNYRFNILIILLIVIFIVWGILLINRYNDYRIINEKIDNIDKLESEIKLLNDNYVKILDKVKIINDFKDKNDILNEDIDEITKDIEDLDYKISKYSK